MPHTNLFMINAWLNRRAETLGLVGLYLFALFAWLGTTPATLGLVLLTLGWAFARPNGRALVHDPVGILALLFGGFVLGHSLIMAALAPSGTSPQKMLTAGLDWLKLLLLIPIAHWCAGQPQRVRRLLLLAALGLTLAVLRKIDWAQFGPEFFSNRFESYLPAIAFGLVSGLGALGFVALRQAFWAGCGSWWRLCQILWLLWLAFMLEGLVLSQSRGAWLAFLGGLGALALSTWQASGWNGLGWLRRHPRQVLLIGVLVVGGLALQHETFLKRFTKHTDTLVQIARGESVTSDPIGLRFKAWLFALERWQERPWFGWGAGSSRTLIAQSGRPQDLFDYDHWLPHLHSTYAELLVQFGLVGSILFGSWLLALVWAGYRAHQSGRLPPDLGSFYLAALICILIWCLFNYRAVHVDWLFIWLLLAGSLYGFKST
ncbi:O-antigen ligase family protein [Caldichromatium japonicum]|uniref:O-antigen ligase family protein n=1 Tax=Caldichromatium japonicum TaxID=2699430 RepID=A0A6G7V9F5_9GAMM|nr:O-antigen ligase family protein [Caldichromatium japonicum]QIK36703.1 O-antigen ligase family protein [Caldichromatium japonicum]